MYHWDDIRIFLAVAGEGSTLAASKTLDMNQTTVSRRIQTLEQALGVTLFERDTRGYALTAQGRSLLDVAVHMNTAAQQVAARAEHLGRAQEGKIRVTASHSAMNHWVLPLISEYHKIHPNIHFETNAAENYVSLENGEADIAVRAADKMTGDTLIVRALPKVNWGIYCSNDYCAANGMPKSVGDLTDHTVLSYPKPMMDSIAHFSWLNSYIDPAKVISTADSVVTMSASLRTEEAVGLLPCVEGDQLGDLVLCFVDDSLTSNLWLVASKEAYSTPRVRKFMAFFGECFPKNGGSARG
jgi:DNA-binding transcriptional LysR family regulator